VQKKTQICVHAYKQLSVYVVYTFIFSDVEMAFT